MTYPGQDQHRRERRLAVGIVAVLTTAAAVIAVVWWQTSGSSRVSRPGPGAAGQPQQVQAIMKHCGITSTAPIPDTNPDAVYACLLGHDVIARATPSMHALVKPLEKAASIGDAMAAAWPLGTHAVKLLGWNVRPLNQLLTPAARKLRSAFDIEVAWQITDSPLTPRWCAVYGQATVTQDGLHGHRHWFFYPGYKKGGSATCTNGQPPKQVLGAEVPQ